MAIDFFEKEVKRLQNRFNSVYQDRVVFDLRSRYLCILAICRAKMLSRSIREITDEQSIKEMNRKFCRIRENLNKFFDLMEAQPKKEVLCRQTG